MKLGERWWTPRFESDVIYQLLMCEIDQIEKGRETLLHGVYGSTVKNLTLTFGSKIFSWLPNIYWDSQKKIGRKTQC